MIRKTLIAVQLFYCDSDLCSMWEELNSGKRSTVLTNLERLESHE